MSKRLMMSEEEFRKRIKELLQIPKEDLLTNYMFQEQEIERLKTFIDEIVKTLKHCKLNGTNKLDIVAEFIEKEYDEQINGVVVNE